MGRVKDPIDAAETQPEAVAEKRITWLLAPLACPPTDEPTTSAYLEAVAADAVALLARRKDEPASARLDALRSLLAERPLPAERGVSKRSVLDWADKYAAASERSWADEYPELVAGLEAHVRREDLPPSHPVTAALRRAQAIGPMAA